MSDTKRSPSLREDQVQLTRERLMEAMLGLLTEGGAARVAVADVAERAGVSARTAYRHYPSSEALLDGFNEWCHARYIAVSPPERVDELPAFVERIAAAYGQMAPILRASRTLPEGDALRERRRKAQAKKVDALLSGSLAHLEDDERRRATAVLHLLTSSDAFLFLADHWQLEKPGEAMRWAVETLMGAVAAPANRRKR